ncbi:hypothetical protein BCR34DRAFT_256825 [Clohesyomyces aquaticus]|uniref:Uncharacterized protein n=1 Tax=Clohesyomyces aquaticus TaxID=1231657 RepID=A0A1Y1ZU45_9PLEO|nr:hypothetical protein BCR34DRAFT_256825 [Clohesyomyces aquaticus]
MPTPKSEFKFNIHLKRHSTGQLRPTVGHCLPVPNASFKLSIACSTHTHLQKLDRKHPSRPQQHGRSRSTTTRRPPPLTPILPPQRNPNLRPPKPPIQSHFLHDLRPHFQDQKSSSSHGDESTTRTRPWYRNVGAGNESCVPAEIEGPGIERTGRGSGANPGRREVEEGVYSNPSLRR